MAGRTPVLTDASVVPDDAVLVGVLRTAWPAWQELMRGLATAGLVTTWRWYRDGGWLCRVTSGARTAAWLAAWDHHATVTCYVPVTRHEEFLARPLPAHVAAAAREAVARGTTVGRSVAAVVEVRSPGDAADALTVIAARLSVR